MLRAVMPEIPVARLKDALDACSQQVGMLRLLARGSIRKWFARSK